MLIYILKRIGLLFVTVWLVMTITFTLLHFMPGNPYPNGDKLKEADIVRLDKAYGFDRPFYMQYADYMTNIVGLKGAITLETETDTDLFGFEFGINFSTNQEVMPELTEAYKYSFTLGIMSLLVGSVIGISLGLLAALKKNGILDMTATFIAVVGISFPSFIFATFLQKWVTFLPGIFSKSNPMSLILPVVALSVFAISQTARVTRTEMVEVLGSNYITLGKAKGVSNKKIVFNYAFRNSMIAVITIFGPLMVSLTTGSLVIEQIFSIPGMGGLISKGVLTNNIYVVLGVTLFISFQIMLMYLIVDILYVFIDPRIKIGGKK